jgi:hypothetical protein
MSDAQIGGNFEPVGSASRAIESVGHAAKDVATGACEAATRTWSATGPFISRCVYTTCYTISYGVVFPAMLLAHSIPRNNAAVRGLIDGAHAAIQKADEIGVAGLEAPVRKARAALAKA